MSVSNTTGSQDSGTQDSGTQDSGTQDSGTQDSGTQDSGTQDSGTQDSGTQDSGTQDSGTQDSGTQDSGTQDSGTQDSGTQDSGTHARMSGHSEARAAVYGLLGAIIGGLATFSGAYWTGHQTISLAQSTSAREACVEFSAAVSQYLIDLDRIKDSINAVGSSYAQARTTALSEVPLLYRDGVEVDLYNNSTVSDDTTQLANALVSINLPIDPKQLDVNALATTESAALKQFVKFQVDSAIELNPNYHQ